MTQQEADLPLYLAVLKQSININKFIKYKLSYEPNVCKKTNKCLALINSNYRYMYRGMLHIISLYTVEVPQGRLKQKLLDTKGVYLLDCHADVFVW